MNITKISLGTLAFFISSFIVQGILGFVLGGDYFMGIATMRQPPFVYLSMSATIMTGIAVSALFPLVNLDGSKIIRGLKFGLFIGFITIPFVALDIPGRFIIHSENTWIGLQGILGLVHSLLSGVLIALVYGNKAK